MHQLLSPEISKNICFGFYIAMLCVYLFLSTTFLRNYYKKRDYKLNLPLSIMFICLFLGRIIFIIFDFFLTNFNVDEHNTYLSTYKIGLFFVLLGFSALLYIIDGLLFKGKDKYLFTIAYFIPVIFIFLSPTIDAVQNWVTISFISWAIIPIGYIYIGIKATGEVRRKAIYIILGVIIYLVSYLFLAEGVIVPILTQFPIYIYDIHSIVVVGKIIGVILIAKGYLKKYSSM